MCIETTSRLLHPGVGQRHRIHSSKAPGIYRRSRSLADLYPGTPGPGVLIQYDAPGPGVLITNS